MAIKRVFFHDYAQVEGDAVSLKTEGGIIISDAHAPKAKSGKLIAIGPCFKDNPPLAVPGMHVFFPAQAAQPVQIGGKDFLILKYEHMVYGEIEDNAPTNLITE